MRDEETGTWWQQVTGEAIHGPLKGRRLEAVVHDEVGFAIWKAERPLGRVLKRDPKMGADDYEDWNWEKQMKKVRTVRPKAEGRPARSSRRRGGRRGGRGRARLPVPVPPAAGPVVDRLGGEAIVLVVGDDRKSIRVFKTTVDGRALSFAAKVGERPLRLVDAETASEWDFSGRAVSGPLEGRQLEKVYALKEYWFDWKTYHPKTGLYTAGLPDPGAVSRGKEGDSAARLVSWLPVPPGIHSPQIRRHPGRSLHALASHGSPRLRRRRPPLAGGGGRRGLHALTREPEGAPVVPGRALRPLHPLGRLQRARRRRVGDEQPQDQGRRVREAARPLQPPRPTTPPSGSRSSRRRA